MNGINKMKKADLVYLLNNIERTLDTAIKTYPEIAKREASSPEYSSAFECGMYIGTIRNVLRTINTDYPY